jgi:hypothetical protein
MKWFKAHLEVVEEDKQYAAYKKPVRGIIPNSASGLSSYCIEHNYMV